MSGVREVLDSVGRTISALLLDHPFHAHVLLAMRREVTDQVGTAAVTVRGGTVWLLVNPVFWMQTLTTERHRKGVLRHEVFHVVLGHLSRHRAFADKERFNVAADLAVNCLIGLEELPQGALHVGHPGLLAEVDQLEYMTAEWYYERLLEAGAAQPHARETASRGAGAEFWQGGDPAVIDAAAAGVIGSSVRAIGRGGMSRLPAMLRRAIEASDPATPPVVDWRRVLRVFSGRSRHTRLVTTLKRPSKRYGRVPGVRVRAKSHVVVAIDTSGSINEAQLATFLVEIRRIWASGTSVSILQVDDAVRSVNVYRGQSPDLSGGGGTDFDPAIDWVNRNSHRVDGLVYFTDADGPRTLSCRCRVLWVVSDAGSTGRRPDCATRGERVVWMD